MTEVQNSGAELAAAMKVAPATSASSFRSRREEKSKHEGGGEQIRGKMDRTKEEKINKKN